MTPVRMSQERANLITSLLDQLSHLKNGPKGPYPRSAHNATVSAIWKKLLAYLWYENWPTDLDFEPWSFYRGKPTYNNESVRWRSLDDLATVEELTRGNKELSIDATVLRKELVKRIMEEGVMMEYLSALEKTILTTIPPEEQVEPPTSICAVFKAFYGWYRHWRNNRPEEEDNAEVSFPARLVELVRLNTWFCNHITPMTKGEHRVMNLKNIESAAPLMPRGYSLSRLIAVMKLSCCRTSVLSPGGSGLTEEALLRFTASAESLPLLFWVTGRIHPGSVKHDTTGEITTEKSLLYTADIIVEGHEIMLHANPVKKDVHRTILLLETRLLALTKVIRIAFPEKTVHFNGGVHLTYAWDDCRGAEGERHIQQEWEYEREDVMAAGEVWSEGVPDMRDYVATARIEEFKEMGEE